MLTHLKNGHVVDPANDRDAVGDLFLADGVVVGYLLEEGIYLVEDSEDLIGGLFGRSADLFQQFRRFF